jgi:hypothetical protein
MFWNGYGVGDTAAVPFLPGSSILREAEEVNRDFSRSRKLCRGRGGDRWPASARSTNRACRTRGWPLSPTAPLAPVRRRCGPPEAPMAVPLGRVEDELVPEEGSRAGGRPAAGPRGAVSAAGVMTGSQHFLLTWRRDSSTMTLWDYRPFALHPCGEDGHDVQHTGPIPGSCRARSLPGRRRRGHLAAFPSPSRAVNAAPDLACTIGQVEAGKA